MMGCLGVNSVQEPLEELVHVAGDDNSLSDCLFTSFCNKSFTSNITCFSSPTSDAFTTGDGVAELMLWLISFAKVHSLDTSSEIIEHIFKV